MADMQLLKQYNVLDEMDILAKEVSPHIVENLNPNMALRDYQCEAITRLEYYLAHPDKMVKPAHLLFAMATGSGKTLIMAASILHLYKQGYRNFIFFVNSTNIIEKTKENFLNAASSKFLFSDVVTIDNENVRIKAVDNFEGANASDINIHFTTIQGLHSRMNNPKENAITFEDFKDLKVVLLSDEAHHMNVDTRNAQGKSLNKGEQEELLSWEGTVKRIHCSNNENIMLEFTATPDLFEPAIADKYKDKLIYDYSLKQFYVDKYSKDVQVLESDNDVLDRALQAVILSQYRQKVFADNGLLIKPVVMFKANAVNPPKNPDPEKVVSSEFREDFDKMISSLSAQKINKIKNDVNIKGTVLEDAFIYFVENGLTIDSLVLQVKEAFSHEKGISIDSSQDNEKNQILINSLEDKDNKIRAVFAVEALNEGWDVLNLFDIVRLYNKRDAKGGKPGKTTISEAQLIGRGARYCPFKVEDTQPLDQRKYDEDLTHEMRICEELYYHSAQNSRYIQELHTALDMVGIKPKDVVKQKLLLKDGFKKTDFYKADYVFVNEQIKNENREINAIAKNIREKNYSYSISSGAISQTEILDAAQGTPQKEITEKEIKFSELDDFLIRKALRLIPFMKFSNLKKYFPNLKTVNDFITNSNYINDIKINISRQKEYLNQMPREELLKACVSVLREISELIEKGNIDKKGTIEFNPKAISEIFKDKEMTFSVDSDSDAETGKSMLSPSNQNLYMNLSEKDWYAFNDCFGTSEEKWLIKFIEKTVDKLKKEYAEVYLLRNEKHFQIYNFEDGQAFEPDFVLFLKNKKGKNERYQLFIEPKGGHLEEKDKWKEDFLLKIKDKADVKQINSSSKYVLYGLPFYNKEKESEFSNFLSKENIV